MTDYPTAADIETARSTLTRLRSRMGGPGPIYTFAWSSLAWSALNSAVAILDHLDDIPGLAPPEPEPKPTAAEVLRGACHATDFGTPYRGITLAAMHYAEAHPEWFANWYTFESTTSALLDAANKAEAAGNRTAYLMLSAAAKVAGSHPELFGGAS